MAVVTPETAPGRDAPLWTTEFAGVPIPIGATLTPSTLGGAKALPGEAAMFDEISATERGEAIHLLLQHLPGRPEADWPDLTTHLIASADLRAVALAEAVAVLANPQLAALFGPNSFSEVGVTAGFGTGRIYGVIDRLILGDDAVLAVDFKSNIVIPSLADAVPEGLLRQLGAYHHILTQLYPDRRVETAILWTRTGALMPVGAEIVSAALQRAARDSVRDAVPGP